MKRTVSIVLAIIFCLSFGTPFAYALDNNTALKEEKIDLIFQELNQLAMQDNLENLYKKPTRSANMQARNERRLYLNNQLEELGVHLLDPNSPEDMARFEDVIYSEYKNSKTSPLSIDDKPNVEYFADRYAIYEFSGNVKIRNENYSYVNYRVVDSKGYGGLTKNEANITMIDEENTVVADLLSYTFEFGVDQFLGSLPHALLLDWTLGGIFTVFDSYDDTSTVSSSSPMYVLALSSITEMMYYYVYRDDLQIWVQAGSSALDVQFSRHDYFSANINGKLETDEFDSEGNSSTNLFYADYYENLIYNRTETHSDIGYFTIEGPSRDYEFEPCYYRALYLLP